ncbi:hypothetical protein PPACK8108_LOCUS20165 [Phakopsora pachyrhizi]|uniref:Uncharacterized protein n=1 Tax=Phakopsora pachyrhizi TaxID=170000 RepID=A0AAV0BG87_PHAPC|nr:hypothetical protein PPACK8108_LOCUS20165 [Phakopsora pachyrhizi]
MTSSTGAFQGKLWKICVVDLQQGLDWLCWAGELSPRQSAGRAGAARARLGLAGSRAGRANGPLAWLGQNGQAGARLWAGKAGWGRLRLGYGQVRQAGARLWAGKAGWGRLGLGYGHAEARLWAGRLWLGYGQVRQAGAWLWAGRLRLGYGQVRQAGARLWAGKAGKAGWGRLWLGPNGQAGAGKAGWGRLGQAVARLNGQAGAGWGLAMGRLGLGYRQVRQAGARLWAGKAGWGRLWLGRMGRLGKAGARLWAGKAGWGRLRLGYGQAVARSNGQAGARLWAGKAGLAEAEKKGSAKLGLGPAGLARSEWAGWGKLGAESWEVDLKITRTDALRHVVDQNSTGVDRVMLISKGTHQGREQAMGWLTAEYQEQMQAQKVIARERGKGQSDRRAGHTHTQAEGNRATNGGLYRRLLEDKGTGLHMTSNKTGNRTGQDLRQDENTRRKIEIPTGGAFRGGFAGRAGQGSAQLGFAGLGPRQVGQARLGLAGSRAGRANDLALKNKYKERRGRLGWVLDRLGSWGLVQLGWAGADKRQVGADWAVQGQVGLGSAWLGWVLDNLGSLAGGKFDLQKPDKNETSTNSSCPRTPKMEKKPKKEKPPGIEENPQKGKTPPGKETSVKDGFKGKTPLAGKGNTVNFE